MNAFYKVAEIHNEMQAFKAMLDSIEALTEQEAMEIVKKANRFFKGCTDCGAEHRYLFDAIGYEFQKNCADFWDRMYQRYDPQNE